MKNIIEIPYEVFYTVFSLISRIINTLFFGGSMHQTLSSRTYYEARFNDRWLFLEWIINDIFFWQDNHCYSAWVAEVTRANKTLRKNGNIEETDDV